ncbi:hypothetical protein [Neorhodopirellula pilleata]|uniref:Uncharacterized protein n=1 Tax=Neorhodopirellula pilleata TaxID=2714738 RepID=A0A5C6A389_9BACT|nr:hypothetical protein [Neorhodopirellula pilleata]TWT94374.1 hypothetical protein Pla100_39860 [Neorhodopirellula pilleata]
MTYDDDEWDDDDYDEFIAREFPDHESAETSRGGLSSWFGATSGGASSLAPVWRWTAWGILALLVFAWIFSLV